MSKYIVYCHINKINNKRYIGITKQTISRRWREGKGYPNNEHFDKAIKKYGWDNFEHIILFEGLTREEATQKEIELIKKYKTQNRKYGYNLTAGGDGTNSPTSEVRLKMRLAKLGTHHESRPCTKETRAKISKANKGKIRSDEFKDKLREINKNSKWSFLNKVRKIKCVETNEIFNSIDDASKKYKFNSGNMQRAIKNNYKLGGYHWQYCKKGNDLDE